MVLCFLVPMHRPRRRDRPRHSSEWIDLSDSILRRARRLLSWGTSHTGNFRERSWTEVRQVRRGRDAPSAFQLFVLAGVFIGTPVSLALAVIWGSRSWWLIPLGLVTGVLVGSIGLLVLFSLLWVVARGIRILEEWLERRRQA
jgi:hypothetical protein